MRFLVRLALSAVATLGLVTGVAEALPGFDFAYEIGGDRRVAPLQIFDDGSQTYIQWPTNVSVPNVVILIDGKKVTSVPGSSPYHVVTAVGNAIEIRSAGNVARANYVGERGRAPMQVAEMAAKAPKRPLSVKPVASDVASATAPTNWELSIQDRTLQAAMSRWAKTSAHELRWLIRDQILIERGSSYSGTLAEALSKLSNDVGLAITLDDNAITVSE